MRSKIGKGVSILLVLLGAAWLSVGSFSDLLVGNRSFVAEAPTCDDEAWCQQIRDLFVVDAHNDTLLHRDPRKRSNAGHVDLARLIQGGVDLQVFAVASVAPKLETTEGRPCGDLTAGDRLTKYFVLKEPLRPATWLSPKARVDRMIERFEKATGEPDQNGFELVRVTTVADLNALMEMRGGQANRVGAVLAVEGAYWASEIKAELRQQIAQLADAGVRMIGLTHRSSNHLAGSNEDCFDRYGLTELGYFAVLEIWRQGLVLDLAHASSKTIADVAQLSAKGKVGAVVVSHTGIRSACNHDRNLTDEDLRNVVRSGGVVSLGFWTTVNCFDSSVTLQEARQSIVRSFVTAYQVLNSPEFIEEMNLEYDPSEHIALGSDFDGATLVPADVSAIPWYLEGIANAEADGQRVFDRVAIENIAGLNLFRLLQGAMEPG